MRSPKYGAAALRNTIIEVVGEETLISDLKHPVIVPAVNLTKGAPQVFKTCHHPAFQRDHRLRVVDVALATSAAPTYFPIAAIGDELFADGGLYGNSPDLIALHEAEHFFEVPSDDVRILSIGTTTASFSFSHRGGTRLGLIGWGNRLAQTIISAQQQDAEFIVRHRIGKRYVRIDRVRSSEQEQELGLDVATDGAQRTIRAMAAGSLQAILGNPMLDTFLSHEAREPVFHH